MVGCGGNIADVFSVLLPAKVLALDTTRQEEGNPNVGTRTTCILPWHGTTKKLLPWLFGGSLDLEGQGRFKKMVSRHLKLSTRGGGRLQGVSMVDDAMVALVPNCLLWSNWFKGPWIPL